MSDAIAVIIPMFNAQATLRATLESVRQQTHAELDIIVVDDGSTDASPQIAATEAAADVRIRVVRQPNSGVAAARNLGAALSSAEYLAFIDADDLWAPPKMALQLAAMKGAGDGVGLVYSWSANITGKDLVTCLSAPAAEGNVLAALCRSNFVGNASTALFRRSTFDQAGWFDRTLRDRGAQGCEDLVIFLAVAERFEFRVVRKYLTGYRVLPNSMSGDVHAMY